MSALLVLTLFYFLPTVIAAWRGHPSAGAIFLLNFFLGWTLLFWILGLVWASSSFATTVVVQPVHGSDGAAIPQTVTIRHGGSGVGLAAIILGLIILLMSAAYWHSHVEFRDIDEITSAALTSGDGG